MAARSKSPFASSLPTEDPTTEPLTPDAEAMASMEPMPESYDDFVPEDDGQEMPPMVEEPEPEAETEAPPVEETPPPTPTRTRASASRPNPPAVMTTPAPNGNGSGGSGPRQGPASGPGGRPGPSSNGTGPNAGAGASRNGPPTSPFGRPGGDDDFVIDLNGVDLSGGFVGVGNWLGYISAVERSQSKAGNPMLVWTATVYQGDYAGKSMKLYTALTPDAMWKFVEVLDAVGYKMPEDNRPNFQDIKAHAIRVLVIMEVIDGEYNGAPRAQLNAFRIPEAGAGTRIPDPTRPV